MVVLFGASVMLAAAACGGDSPSKTAPTVPAANTTSKVSDGGSVTIKMFKFDPTPLKVSVGTKVTWTNADDILHTVTSGEPGKEDGKINGEMNGQGKSFTFAFTTPGTYNYFCSRHNGMRGEVDVS